MRHLLRVLTSLHLTVSVLLLVALLSGESVLASTPTVPSIPDVLLTVDLRSPNGGVVDLIYSKAVARDIAEAHLQKLTEETGWTVLNTKVEQTSAEKDGFESTTMEAAFSASVDVAAPVLPVEHIISALRDQESIEVLFVTAPNSRPSAVGDFENRYVKILLSPGGGTYRYDIRIKDSGFGRLGLPNGRIATSPAASGSEVAGIGRAKAIVLVMLALVFGALAYIAAANLVRRSR